MMSHFDLLLNDDNTHSLLEPPIPAYTSVTVRRAFIVWLQCGQRNEFRNVCNYFHYLETLEDRLSPEDRAHSRLQEFNLLSNEPPSSYYLNKYFPKLYRQNKYNMVNVKQIEEIRLEDCVFNLEGFHDLKIQKGVTTKEIIKTSQMIRKYCKTHSKSLKKLLIEFQDFAKKTEVTKSVNNISVYIKKKYLKDELETHKNLPKNFSFLDIEEDTSNICVSSSKTEDTKTDTGPTFEVDNKSTITKNANKIRILINEARRKELMSLLPHLSELTTKDCDSTKYSSQHLISPKVIEVHKKTPSEEFEFANKI